MFHGFPSSQIICFLLFWNRLLAFWNIFKFAMSGGFGWIWDDLLCSVRFQDFRWIYRCFFLILNFRVHNFNNRIFRHNISWTIRLTKFISQYVIIIQKLLIKGIFLCHIQNWRSLKSLCLFLKWLSLDLLLLKWLLHLKPVIVFLGLLLYGHAHEHWLLLRG